MGPLSGFRIVEIAGIGPGPFVGMMFADMGADVIVVDRTDGKALDFPVDINRRGKRSIMLDLKSPKDKETLFKLVKTADGLFEGFRPGVMEKLGLGPDDLWVHNPKLVYGRMTGWGQTGPLAHTAGHDINYLALSGALHAIGAADSPPTIPLNLIADYGGGAMMLAFGMVCALLEMQKSDKGQVVDAAMAEGASLLMSLMHSLKASGLWAPARGVNMLDGGAHFYNTYETADGHHVSFGAMEPQFMQIFVEKAGLEAHWIQQHMNQKKWPELKLELTKVFKSKTSAEWQALLEGTDACFSPILPFWEAHTHPQHKARESFVDIDGLTQPGPAPRFSRTPPKVQHGTHAKGADTDVILAELGIKTTP